MAELNYRSSQKYFKYIFIAIVFFQVDESIKSLKVLVSNYSVVCYDTDISSFLIPNMSFEIFFPVFY